ncbi:BMP family lipoprotein [Chloroflexus sp.]|uniref:BMP family lipoprotein n=1 Tax=Chloroflexus sp. TaxID=1904827 RepID=UPI004049A17F
MRKTLLTLVALFTLLVPLLAACGGQPTTTPTATTAPTAAPTAVPTTGTTDSSKPRIALVTDLGKVNDGTFNEFAHLGALRAAQEFGLEYKYIETQAQADYEKNIQTFVDEGFDVIVTVGFLIADATKKFAAEHPDIIFIGVDQFYEPGTVTDNLVGLQFREDQAGFLAGALAGMMTQSGTVGVVAGVEIPPVKRFKNAFDNGARYVNPNINLLGVYLPTFIDPALGASTAQQMIGEGADVIFGAGGPTGSGAIKEAAARGVYVIGVDQDEYVTTFANGSAPGADRILSSAIKRVDVAVYDQIKAVVNGTFKGNGIALYEAANGGIGYADYHDTAGDVPNEVKVRMEQILAALTNGTLTTGVDPVSGDVDPKTIPESQPFRPADVKLPRIALVTDLGKVNDGTFNEFAHLGALRAAQEFGLEYKYIETQAQADYEKNIQTFVDEGFDVIVTVGFLIADATKKFAAEHPDIIFIGVDQFYEPGTVTDNLVGLQFREDQAGFLAGALAGMMTQSGTVGVVAGVEIPPVKRFKNAFDNGARYVNPNINLLGVYLPTFIDPALGASTAQQMIGEGADVIFGAGGPTGSGAIKEAAARGVYVIGVDQDEYVTTFANGSAPGADRILSSAIKRVDVAVYDQIKAVVNGTFKGNGIALYEAANGGIGYADYHDTADDVPDAVKSRMEEILVALTRSELTTGVDPVSGDVDPNTIPEPQPFQR